MPKVYVTSEVPGLDYQPAYEYGSELVAVFPPGQIQLSPQVALYHARTVLRQMTADDYLVLSGDPVKIGICVAVAAELLGEVQMLRWNRDLPAQRPLGARGRELPRPGRYFPVSVNFLDRKVTTA